MKQKFKIEYKLKYKLNSIEIKSITTSIQSVEKGCN